MRKQLREFFYAMLGAPDYEKYLEHFKKMHPDKTPLSKKEFFIEQTSKRKTKC